MSTQARGRFRGDAAIAQCYVQYSESVWRGYTIEPLFSELLGQPGCFHYIEVFHYLIGHLLLK